MFTVGREIHFSYGHRLTDYQGKCAHLHGHNGRILVELSSHVLNHQGMVMDFYEIKSTLGAWIDRTLDHRMILARQDPLAAVLQKNGEPVALMDESPTAEAIARWIFRAARDLKLPVSRVTLWETENSFAVYEEPLALGPGTAAN